MGNQNPSRSPKPPGLASKKPTKEKFLITIKEVSDDDKLTACGSYGLSNLNRITNFCLANYELEVLENEVLQDTLHNLVSVDSFAFGGFNATLFLRALPGLQQVNEFTLFDEGANSYISHGRCEKIE